MQQGNIATRPFRTARHWWSDPGGGDSAPHRTRPGLQRGAVAGNAHVDLCAALLVEEYGKRWFEQGALSLFFRNAISDGERVQAACEVPQGTRQVALWVRREDGLEVATGTASLGEHDTSALRTRDLRPADPADLRILRRLTPGESLGEWDVVLDGSRQLARYHAGVITDPLSWYAQASPWGGPVAAPSSVVNLLWGLPGRGLADRLGDAVGVFGAIEVAHHAGPLMLGERYRVGARLVAVSESPRTESLWFDSWARAGGRVVASQRIMLRFMKASSPFYQTAGRPKG